MRGSNRAVDDSSDLIDNPPKHVAESADMLPAWGGDVSYRYLEGNLVVIAHIGLRGNGLEKHNLCATVYSSLEPIDLGRRPEDWRLKDDLRGIQMREGEIE